MVGAASLIPTETNFIFCWNFSKSLADVSVVHKCQKCQICVETENFDCSWFPVHNFRVYPSFSPKLYNLLFMISQCTFQCLWFIPFPRSCDLIPDHATYHSWFPMHIFSVHDLPPKSDTKFWHQKIYSTTVFFFHAKDQSVARWNVSAVETIIQHIVFYSYHDYFAKLCNLEEASGCIFIHFLAWWMGLANFGFLVSCLWKNF